MRVRAWLRPAEPGILGLVQQVLRALLVPMLAQGRQARRTVRVRPGREPSSHR